jgi:hypothetical protein
MSQPRSNSLWIGVLAVLGGAAIHGLPGCGKPPIAYRATSIGEDAAPGTGGAAPGTGGSMIVGPEEVDPGTGGRASGGTGGRADTGSLPRDASTAAGGTGGTDLPDADISTGGTVGTGGAMEDAAAGGSGGTGGGSGGTGGTPATGGQSGTPDAARPISSGPAACHPDPNVIKICKQLEPACQNCPDRAVWDECFRVSAAGNDTACARYAADNDCTVDQGGNWCGSLDCTAQGCPRASCRDAQGNGASGACQAMLDECPCQ